MTSGLLFAIGVALVVLSVNALFPARRLLLLGISFLAQWLVAELAHWCILAFGAATVALVALGALDHWSGWVGLAAVAVGVVLLVIETVLALRSAPAVQRALSEAGLAPATPDRGRWRRLLLPLWLHDRRVERLADLRYTDGAGRRHLCDVYRPRGGVRGAPVLLQIHGGGWFTGHKRQQARPLMNRMAAHGWVCVAINYRLAPRAKMPAQIVDVKHALAWIRAHIAEHGGDPRRVVVTGGSAGGHLAAMAALTIGDPTYQPGFEDADTGVLAAVSLYPPTDLAPLFEFPGRRTGRWADRTAAIVFGESPSNDPDRFRAWSPIELVSPGVAPFLVIQGTADNLVPVAHARAFVEALREIPGHRVVYVELPGAPHAFDVFHSIRSEVTAAGIHRFCDGVVAGVAVADADVRADDEPETPVRDGPPAPSAASAGDH